MASNTSLLSSAYNCEPTVERCVPLFTERSQEGSHIRLARGSLGVTVPGPLGLGSGRRSRAIQDASMSRVPHPRAGRRWLSYDPRDDSGSWCWRRSRRNNVLRSDLRCLLARQHPSRVIYPDFKRFVPAEINQRGDNKYLGKRAHSKATFSKSRPGRKCC
jgi:hypothetical protein